MPPTKRPAITVGLGDVDRLEVGRGHEGAEERERGERRRADREALADGGGGVADGVELVGAFADFLGQLGHLGDAAGVVGDRAVGIDGELDAGVGEHADGGDGDAVEPGEVEGADDDGREHEDRPGGRAHADAETGDDVGGGAGERLLGDAADRPGAGAGVVLGDHADREAGDEADDRRPEDADRGDRPLAAVENVVEGEARGEHAADDEEGEHDHHERRAELADVERPLRASRPP